ncbi:MAG: tyrosine-type recombinase/integrase [Candidatus Xenobia bacterium]
MDWSSLIAAYLTHLQALGRNPATLGNTRRWLQRLVAFADDAALTPIAFTDGHLVAFQAQMLWQQTPQGGLYTPHSIYQCLQMVRAFLDWCAKTGELSTNAAAKLTLPRPRVARPPLPSPEDIRRLCTTPPNDTAEGQRDRVLLELLALGLRRGECAALDLAQVDREAGTVQVPRRCLVMPSTLRPALDLYLESGRPQLLGDSTTAALLLGRGGGRFSPSRVDARVHHLARAAGLPGVTARTLRRAVATQLWAGGMTIRQVAEHLGQRHPGNTRELVPPGPALPPTEPTPTSRPTPRPKRMVTHRRPNRRKKGER